MNFSITKDVLLSTLQLLSKATPKRSTLPVLGCALFTQNNKNLNIRTTDMELSISIVCEIDGEGEGSLSIPLPKLLEITMAISDEKIYFSTSDIGKVVIKCEKGQYTIMGLSHDEFPAEQTIKEGTSLGINGNELKKIIQNTSYAASRDDLKPVLQGVLFQISEKGFISVATDGHRLVKFEKTDIKTDNSKGSVVVPTKFLILLNQLIEEEKDISLTIGKNNIRVEIESGSIISKIITDPFPDYEGVIPQDNNKTLIIDKNSFEEAIKRVSIFSNKSSRQVALNISENNIIITTEDPENITSGKETLDCNYDGEPIIIGYSASYLKEVLQHQHSNEIKILLNTPLNAGLFLPMEQTAGENKTTLLMPIRLND